MNDDPVLTDLFRRCREDHRAWINGDASPYALPHDGTLLGALGGHSRGGARMHERQRAAAASWRRGEGDVEYLNGGTVGSMAWLAMVERGTVQFGSDDDGVERRWDLRVTEIWRMVDGDWRRIHRHADPLVDRHALADVVALLE